MVGDLKLLVRLADSVNVKGKRWIFFYPERSMKYKVWKNTGRNVLNTHRKTKVFLYISSRPPLTSQRHTQASFSKPARAYMFEISIFLAIFFSTAQGNFILRVLVVWHKKKNFKLFTFTGKKMLIFHELPAWAHAGWYWRSFFPPFFNPFHHPCLGPVCWLMLCSTVC